MRPPIPYTVDDEPQSTTEEHLTAAEILRHAGIDPNTCYLVLVQGQQQDSFKDHLDQQIHMHPNLKFISICTGPTPVS